MTDEQSPDFTLATPSEDVRSMQFGIHPDDLNAGDFDGDPHSLTLAILREAAEHFSSPFEPADVSDEEIEEKATFLFGDSCEAPGEIEQPKEGSSPRPDDASGTYWFTPFEFSLRLPLRVLSAQEEATAFWFFPMHGDREPKRKKRRSSGNPWGLTRRERSYQSPLDAQKERLAAELDVRSTRWRTALQGPSSPIEGLSELHLFVLALPQRLDANWQTCKHCSPERPSSYGKSLQGTSETLLVLFDSVPSSSSTVAPWKQRSAAVGEYQWRSLDRGRRWLTEVAEHLSERREVPRSEVGAVLWLADPQSPAGSPGAAALVPVPEWLQPARDHLPQLSELWDSTLRNYLAREINDACRQ
ncbi:hypothetical protein [Streptomyces sp. NPDC056468]|uniref:hypothetical protein n=1 Tax=Streptomyces sp. NPDC056468 TaxID=3345830 RepID=UPI0036CCFB07